MRLYVFIKRPRNGFDSLGSKYYRGGITSKCELKSIENQVALNHT